MRVNTYSYAYTNGRRRNVSPVLVIGIVVGLFFIIGGLFGTIGVFIDKSERKVQEKCTEPITAYVVDYKHSHDGLRTPIYSYEYQGKKYEYSGNSYSNEVPYYVGDKADIMIDPNSPKDAFVPADKTSHTVAVVFKIVGFGIMGVGVIVVLVALYITHLGKKQELNDDLSKYEQWQ